jgi:hypothetical protein
MTDLSPEAITEGIKRQKSRVNTSVDAEIGAELGNMEQGDGRIKDRDGKQMS